jgi:hypothetical protein
MSKFTTDNTEGYTAADLQALNAAWAQMISEFELQEDDKPILDHWSEQLLVAYDAGKRGKALTAWFYDGTPAHR